MREPDTLNISPLTQACRSTYSWRLLSHSALSAKSSLTRKLCLKIIGSALRYQKQVFKNLKNSENGIAKINHDTVLLEILVFLIPFSQASIKSGFSDLWSVPSFQSKLKNPTLETSPCLLEFVGKNTSLIEANLLDLFMVRQKEYFQQNGIDNFLSNLSGAVLEDRIQRHYKKNEHQEKLQPLLKQGLGTILAEHNLALIKTVGRS